MRPLSHHHRRAILGVPVVVLALALACQPTTTGAQTIPLYPNAATTRLPPGQLAQVSGPIAEIDGNQVIDYGRPFELLPGCHLVQMQQHLPVNGISVRRPGSFGPLPIVIYALRMRAGARYVIRQDLHPVGALYNPFFRAREEQANGTTIDLAPIRSPADVKACQGWETAVLRSDQGRTR